MKHGTNVGLGHFADNARLLTDAVLYLAGVVTDIDHAATEVVR